MRETPYEAEEVLQALIAKFPSLLAGGLDAGEAVRRWVLVAREAALPDDEDAAGRWSVDHLFLDQQAVPTLVEVKRSDDTRIRRAVVGQMLDYAANGVVYWPAERLRADFEAACAKEGKDADEVFRDSLGDDLEPEQFWDEVGQNLLSGRIRLVFVSDLIPRELRRVIEFLNERMSPTEVVGVEIKQYVGRGNLTTLVPRVVGQTEQARAQKIGGGHSWGTEVGWEYYEARVQPDRLAIVRSLFERIQKAVEDRGLGWVPRLRSSWFTFQRPGDYSCAGGDIYRERPVDFWIKLPLPPDELRRRGHDIPSIYPELEARWDESKKQWRWG